ncbi:MAG: SH3 domain-containing protein, partial [Lachnospiraceae bacterium]|nr:SH3 domain-containing protein [Lachnospiraceae bacterium]
MISNSGHDENGKYSGGAAGDQTEKEWAIIGWYNRPWKCVIRHPDSNVRKTIASLSEKAAKNDNIGYDQGQRVSYWNELAKVKYNPSAIKTKCEADCSAGVMANVKATGYLLDNAKLKAVSITSTHYMR